jgi:hypothetical protein
MISALLIAALAVPADAHLDVLDAKYEPKCVAQRFEPSRVLGSGRVAVRYHGNHCEGWAWVKLKVTVQRLAARKALKAGDLIDGATELVSSDLRPGDDGLETIPQGARAASDIPAGAMLTADRVRIGPAPGASIEVLIQAGAIAVEESGTVVRCSGRGEKVCASLPTGRRVSGHLDDGRLLVDFRGAP